MNQVNFDYWLDEVVPNISGAEIPFILLHIRNAAIEFCERSLAWNLQALPIDIIASKAEYQLVPPVDQEDAEIVQVLKVIVGIDEILPRTLLQLSALGVSPSTKIKYYVQDYVEAMTLWPIPSAPMSAGLNYKVALRPSRVADGMNGSVAKRYFEAIANGAKARLYKIPNKPWSDGSLAVYYQNEFNRSISMARDEVVSGLGRGVRRTKVYY